MINGIPTTEIILLVLFFIGAREFWFKIDINMVKNHVYSSFYFSFWSLILLLTFGYRLTGIASDFTIWPFIALASFFGLSGLLFYILKHKFKPPKIIMKRYPKERFLTLSYKYLFAKSFDILFQQIAVITAIVMLAKSGVDFLYITTVFALVFGFLHIRIVQKEGNIGWAYVIGSTFAGIIFPFLILYVNFGFIYTFIIHWSYYILLATYFWMKVRRQIET